MAGAADPTPTRLLQLARCRAAGGIQPAPTGASYSTAPTTIELATLNSGDPVVDQLWRLGMVKDAREKRGAAASMCNFPNPDRLTAELSPTERITEGRLAQKR